MKPGTILHRFIAKDGKNVILRTLKWEDLDDQMRLINSLVEEGAETEFETKITR